MRISEEPPSPSSSAPEKDVGSLERGPVTSTLQLAGDQRRA
jgi:hypothetical protein